MIGEFDIIKTYLKGLTKKSFALNLAEDCALIDMKNSQKLIVNTDSIAEKSHFFSNSSPKSIANKLLGVNLSDIASMGGSPLYWSFSLGIREDYKNHTWLSQFTNELKKIQNKYNFHLIGGDTITTQQLVLTCTMVATIKNNAKPLLQSRAKEGDIICVSNSIGNSYWGLQLLLNLDNQEYDYLSQPQKDFLINNYNYISPQIVLGNLLLNYANSCTDISDGLILDLEKIVKNSNVIAKINLQDIPFSKAVAKIHGKNSDNILKSIGGGDDYQLVFTINEKNLIKLKNILATNKLYKNIQIKEIGQVVAKINKSDSVVNKNSNLKVYHFNQEIKITKKGFVH
jgi:thiamine-monophosphate kinase